MGVGGVSSAAGEVADPLGLGFAEPLESLCLPLERGRGGRGEGGAHSGGGTRSREPLEQARADILEGGGEEIPAAKQGWQRHAPSRRPGRVRELLRLLLLERLLHQRLVPARDLLLQLLDLRTTKAMSGAAGRPGERGGADKKILNSSIARCGVQNLTTEFKNKQIQKVQYKTVCC